ncbi:MAG: hypothetical protein K5696_00305 [Lachnospiraceae bacterium]|nr:hypothetical protein [Lachnospiraceae bacterium]
MKLKYYLRGMGIGMILTAIIMGIALHGRSNELSDAEIMARARELGMIDSTVLSDYAAQGSMGAAMGGTGENGNSADGGAGTSVRSVTQTGDTISHKVVFEKLDPAVNADASSGSGNSADTDGGRKTGSESTEASTEGSALVWNDPSQAAANAAVAVPAAAAEGDAFATTPVVIEKSAAIAARQKTDSQQAASDQAKTSAASAVASAKAAEAASSAKAQASAGSSAKTQASAGSSAKTQASIGSSAKTKASAGSSAKSEAQTAASTASSRASAAVASEAGTTTQTAVAPATGTGADTPAAPAQETANTVSVSIPGGVGSETVAAILEREGLIDSASAFDDYLCKKGIDRVLRSGTKSIPAGADWDTIASILTR